MRSEKPIYKRVLLKVSGEALAGDEKTGLDFAVMNEVCQVIGRCVAEGVEVGVVVGGGNFWRGVKNGEGKMNRAKADYMGMMATVMNCIALQDVLEQNGVPAKVMTGLAIQSVGEVFCVEKAAPKHGCHAVGGDDGRSKGHMLRIREGIDVEELTDGLENGTGVAGGFLFGDELLALDTEGIDGADNAAGQKRQLIEIGRAHV